MLIFASIAAVVLLGVFLYLVQSGWFAGMKRGFLISLILAVAGTAFISASLLGVWAWTTARDILFQQVIADLRQVGDAAHSNLTDAMKLVFGELSGDAREIAKRLSARHPDDVADELEIIVESNNGCFKPMCSILRDNSLLNEVPRQRKNRSGGKLRLMLFEASSSSRMCIFQQPLTDTFSTWRRRFSTRTMSSVAR
jgi:hypothetical protein